MADLHPPEPDANGADAGGGSGSAAGGEAADAGTLAPTPPYSKRRRRPSVRLGDIGVHPAAADLPLRRHTKTPSSHPRLPRRSHADENLAGPDRRVPKPPPRRARSSWVPASSAVAMDGYYEEDEPYYDEEGEHSDSAAAAAAAAAAAGRARVSGSREASGDESDGVADWGLPNGRFAVAGHGRVKAWLDGLGLARYAPVFEIHEVDDEVLPMLTLEDLKDMGISAVGSRRKMYAAIQKLRKNNVS